MFLLQSVQTVALDAILNSPELNGATVAATVTDSSGTVLYSRNGTLKVVPASNEKLFSAAFALFELGPTFRPTTRFWKVNNMIQVDSTGDPMMSYSDLVKARKALGSDQVPILVKESYDPEFPETWEVGDLPNRYAAPVSSFSVDQSGFELWNNNGQLALRPEAYGVKINYAASDEKPEFAYDPIRKVVTASGKFPKTVTRLDTLAVPNGLEAAVMVLSANQPCRRISDVPSSAPSYTIEGKSLSEVLAFCLQHSDNNMAENLLLMGAGHTKSLNLEHPYPDALAALKEFESKTLGINPADLNPVDGCGLTRSNYVTTNAITSLLNWADHQTFRDVWKKSLASPGVGTLARRLKGVPFQGKTGSLSHVTALSGYLVNTESKNLTVSVIFNNFTCSEEKARGVIDQFIRKLFEKTP